MPFRSYHTLIDTVIKILSSNKIATYLIIFIYTCLALTSNDKAIGKNHIKSASRFESHHTIRREQKLDSSKKRFVALPIALLAYIYLKTFLQTHGLYINPK